MINVTVSVPLTLFCKQEPQQDVLPGIRALRESLLCAALENIVQEEQYSPFPVGLGNIKLASG